MSDLSGKTLIMSGGSGEAIDTGHLFGKIEELLRPAVGPDEGE